MIVYSKYISSIKQINPHEKFKKENVSKINLWNEKFLYVSQLKDWHSEQQLHI